MERVNDSLDISRGGLQFQVQFVNTEFVAQQELQQASLYSKVLRILSEGKPFSTKQISEQLGQKDVSGQLIRVIKKLVDDKLIARTIPDVRNHPSQKHIKVCFTSIIVPISSCVRFFSVRSL